jgi:hypothetical protein
MNRSLLRSGLLNSGYDRKYIIVVFVQIYFGKSCSLRMKRSVERRKAKKEREGEITTEI